MINHVFSYGKKRLHVKRLDEYETNADQLTHLRFGGVSSTCPTTKVILRYTWSNMTNTGCLIVNIISHYPFVCRLIIITLNDAHIWMFELCWFKRFMNLLQMTLLSD